ncbi:MAG: hypothetical protein AABY53_06885 [Bdellovibrionota bacterium]
MKKLILIISKLALILAMGLMGASCSKSNSNSSGAVANPTGAVGPAPVVIDPIGPGSPGDPNAFGLGATVDLITTNDKMRAYTTIPGSLTAVNNPTNIKINLNLAQSESGRYGGAIAITYTDNGQQHSGVFRAGMGRNQTISGGYDNNELEAKYNYWFTFENRLVFTAFYEDSYGAIVISLTPETGVENANDAEPLNVKYKGEVYFRNFRTEKTTPYRSCWFIYTGLNGHDCRSGVIEAKVGLAPGSGAGYTLLGTFTNVVIKQAFNIN